MAGRSSPRDGDGDDFTRITGIGKALDRRLHQAGVDSYVVKPFTPQVLREKIDAVLASRAAA